MGCSKSRSVTEITVTHVPNTTLIAQQEPLESEEQPVRVPETIPVEYIAQDYPIYIDDSILEVGKVGEDYEAGILQHGKLIEESLDKKLQKQPLPKKLPPIKNAPLPSTLNQRFVKKSMPSHKPNHQLITDLLSGEDKGFQFEGIHQDSSRKETEKLIENIMKELSIQ